MWLLRHGRTVFDRVERPSDDTRIYRPTPSSRRPQVVPSSAVSSTQSVSNSECGSTQLLLPRRHSHHSHNHHHHHHHRQRPGSESGVSSTNSVAASECGSNQLLLPGKPAASHHYHRPSCRHYTDNPKLTNMKELNLLLTAPHVPDLLTEKNKEEDVAKPSSPATELDGASSDHEEPQECRVPPINADLPFPTEEKQPVFLGTQVIAALSVSLGSMVVGYASGYTSPGVPSMEDTASFSLNEQEKSWIGSIMPLAAMFGGIAGGPFIEGIGRRTTILATAVPFIVSWFLIALAQNVAMVLTGRAIAGFCVGVASLSLPVYLGETVQPEVRGTLGLLPTTFGNTGILLVFLAGKYMDWSSLAMLGGCLPVPFLICMFLIPETPRWYISKNKPKRAKKALQWLRGKKADISAEFNEIEKSASDSEKSQGDRSRCSELFRKQNIKPLLISIGLMFFQQMSGINAVIFYTTRIFRDAGSTLDQSLCTIIVGIVNFFSTFVATILIDRLGRKILLYISAVFMSISLAALSAYFFLKDSKFENIEAYGWLPLVSFVVYVVAFSIGLGPVPWLMMGEILPANIRGSAASLATAFNWSCTFIVTKTFGDLVQAAGMGGTFSIFFVICVGALFFTIFFVPETQGQSLEDIEKKMTGRRVRRMSSIANLKPMPMGL